MSVTLELRMTLKLLHSVEGLVKATRNCGPFGGVSIESVSIPSVIKKAEELAEYQFKKLPKAEEVTSLAKVIKVSFEDKFEKSKRIQVEEYRVELVRIPEDLNGFEYLCHPHLEKEEHLVGYFKAWHNTTLMSLYYLIHNSPLVMYFLSPTTSNEQEVSYQLRKRYNLIVETEEASIENSPKEIEKMKEEKMNLVINTRHDIKRILIKLKIYQMKDFSTIIQELESHKREFMMTTHAESKGRVQNRARFFSDELPEQAIIRRRERMKAEEAAVYKYSMDTTTNPVNNSLDLMASNRSGASRPFKLQEGILEERAVQSKRRMSLALSLVDSSLTNMYRKNSQYNFEDLDYTLTEVPESNKKESTPDSDEKSCPGRRKRRQGLANIGSQLLLAGNLDDEMMDMDEDDRIVEISNSLECAQMSIKVIQKTLLEKQKAKPGKAFVPSRFIFNLTDSKNKAIQSYLNLGDWIEDQKPVETITP